MRTALLPLAVWALSFSVTASATDLVDVYTLAQRHDATLQKAQATRQAQSQSTALSRAALLPHLSASAQYQKRTGDGSSAYYQGGSFVTPQTTTDSTQKGYSLSLSQSIFNWQNWSALGQADLQATKAQVDYQRAVQDLIVRTAKAYFAVLTAQDNVDAAKAKRTALHKQLQQVKQRKTVGLSASADVQDIQAAYDNARAQVIAQRQTLVTAQDALTAIVGQRVGDLAQPGDTLTLKKPQPASAKAWVQQAIQGNLNLAAARLATQIAAKEVAVQRAARYPSLTLSASHSRSLSDDNGAVNGFVRPRQSQFSGNNISLQLSVPIYSGGAIAARTRQAKYQRVAAEAQTQITARQVRQNTRDAFLGVLTGISKVKALKAAMVSAQTALRANIVGRKVGSRTTVDVLNARDKLLSARTQYTQARYQYLLDGLLLKQAAGGLNADDVKALNQLLEMADS